MANKARLNIKRAADRIAAVLERANSRPKEEDGSLRPLPNAPVSAADDDDNDFAGTTSVPKQLPFFTNGTSRLADEHDSDHYSFGSPSAKEGDRRADAMKPFQVGDSAYLLRRHSSTWPSGRGGIFLRTKIISEEREGYVIEQGFWVSADCLCTSPVGHEGNPCIFCDQSWEAPAS